MRKVEHGPATQLIFDCDAAPTDKLVVRFGAAGTHVAIGAHITATHNGEAPDLRASDMVMLDYEDVRELFNQLGVWLHKGPRCG